jgi:HlyD family secretion protein
MRQIILLLSLAMMTTVIGCNNNGGLASGSGLIETGETIVSAETSGRVVDHRFTEGDEVTIGDALVVIDPSRLELELASAQAGLAVLEAQLITARLQVRQAAAEEEFVESEFARAERLLNSGTTTQRQYDLAEFEKQQAGIARETASAQVEILQAQLTKTEADIARLERRLTDCYVTAPVSGVVTEKFVDPGELLSPGKSIARIARVDTVWVKIYLTSGRFAEVKLGDLGTISTESGNQEFRGRVTWTSAEAEFTPKNVQTEQARADLVYAVKLSIANPDRTLKVGMPVFVTLGEAGE